VLAARARRWAGVECAAKDAIGQRAADACHQLLRDEPALLEEIEAHFAEKMRAARMTFGGRLLCPFLRPSFVAQSDYEQIRTDR